jgi:hypothetical protein
MHLPKRWIGVQSATAHDLPREIGFEMGMRLDRRQRTKAQMIKNFRFQADN